MIYRFFLGFLAFFLFFSAGNFSSFYSSLFLIPSSFSTPKYRQPTLLEASPDTSFVGLKTPQPKMNPGDPHSKNPGYYPNSSRPDLNRSLSNVPNSDSNSSPATTQTAGSTDDSPSTPKPQTAESTNDSPSTATNSSDVSTDGSSSPAITQTAESENNCEISNINEQDKEKLQEAVSSLESELSIFEKRIASKIKSNSYADIRNLDQQKQICKSNLEKYKNSLQELEEKEQKCEESDREFSTAEKELRISCSKFSGGEMKCHKAIKACEVCPDEEDSEDYDCAKIHDKTECPARLGEELESAKERRDKFHDEVKDYQEKISELEKDIVEKENDLNEKLSEINREFTENTQELQRKTEEAKADLEDQLSKAKTQISSAISTAIANVQKEINNSLKIAHSFENTLVKAYRDYRLEKRKIIMECELQAQGRLAEYRKRRRQAIRSGSYQINISSLLKKGRTSFKQKDTALLKKYNSKCLLKRKPDFQMAKEDHAQKLRVIEQQKEQYQARLKQTKSQIAVLNNKARAEQNKQVEEYAQKMNKIVSAHQRDHIALQKNYLSVKNSHLAQSKKIHVLLKQLSEQKPLFQNKQMELVREREMISYLKSKGTKSGSEQKDLYAESAAALASYKDALESAMISCSCKEEEDKKNTSKAQENSKCKNLKDKKSKFADDKSKSDDNRRPFRSRSGGQK